MIASAALFMPLLALGMGMIASAPSKAVVPAAAADVAAEKPPSSDAAALPQAAHTYRRILAPAERMRDWPLGTGRYLPMDAAEFERLAALMSPQGKSVPTPPLAAAVAARHEARLEGERLLGRSELDVVLRGSAPARLNLASCNLAIEQASWKSADKTQDNSEAEVGLGDDGSLQARVERTGILELGWTLRGKRGAGDALLFVMHLPPTAAGQLVLELPKELTPSVDSGLTLDGEPTEAGTLRWRIALGGRTRLRLRIAAAGTSEAGRPLAFLRESRTYDCPPRGLEVAAQWKLQVHDEPLAQIAVLLDPGLQLISARLGEEPVSWSVVVGDGGTTRAILQLPEPIVESERVLRLTAVGRTPVAEAWRLPRIRAEGLSWQEGSITLLIPDPLTVERLQPIGCVQTGVGTLSPPRNGRSDQFQCYQSDATVEVRLARRRPELQTLSAAQVELSAQSATARQMVDCRVAGGALLSIQGELSPRWIVESIESIPAGRVSDWTVDADAEGQRQVTIHVSGAPLSRQPLRLEIVARRPAEEKTAKLVLGELAPVVFQRNQGSRQLLSLVAGAGLDIELAGRQRPRMLRAEELTPVERELFGPHPLGLLFECNADNNRVLLTAGENAAKTPPPTTDRVAEHEIVWIWREQLQSWYLSDGRSRHLATFAVQHAGKQVLRLALSPHAGPRREDIHAVRIDGQTATYQTNAGEDQTAISLELPEKDGISRATIEWTETAAQPGAFGARSVRPPKPDLPVLARDWTLHLPADFAAVGCGGDAAANVFYPPLGDAAARFFFVRRSAQRLTAAVVFLIAMLIGIWRRETAANILLAAILLACAAAAMMAPRELLSPVLSGILGAAVSLGWRRARRFVRHSEVKPGGDDQASAVPLPVKTEAGQHSTVSMVLPTGFLAVCLAFAAGGIARAEDYQVFVPIDAQRRPVGEMVYLPEAFYRELLRQEHQSAAAPQWLIAAATYRGELARQSAEGRLGVGNLRGQFDLRVFDRGVTVTLPSRGDDPIGSVLLDGLPVEPRREPETGKTTLRIDEPGRYRLEYSIRTVVRGNGSEGGFEAVVPRTPTARLELVLPDGAPAIDVPAALGGVERGDDSRRLSAQLGPTERLAASWPEEANGSSVASQVEAEQLVWLKVHPGSVLVVARFKFRVGEGQLTQARLAVDSRLRVLPPSGNNPPEVRMGAETGQSRVLSIRWPRPIAERTMLEVAMLLSGASGVGNVPLPKVELLEPRPSRRWMAVSVDDSLEYNQQRAERLESSATADFLHAWGATASAPKFAYRLGESPPDWSISTRPRQPRGEARQSLHVVPAGDGAEIRYEARYRPLSGYVFQHRLKAPKGLQIDSVSVIEQNVQRMHHWSRDEDGAVTIFLDEPAAGAQTIAIRGRSDEPAAQHWKPAQFRLEQCDLRNEEFNAPSGDERPTGGGASASVDAAVAWREGGRFSAAAAIVVDPGGSESLTLQMPPRCKLLQAKIIAGDGSRRPADFRAADNGELTLRNMPLRPQRIELAYHGEGIGPDRDGRLRLQAPAIKGESARRTRWMIVSPHGWTIEAADDSATFSSWDADEKFRDFAAGAERAQLISTDVTSELTLDCRREATSRRPPGWLVAAAALAVLAAMVFSRPCGNRPAIAPHRRSPPTANARSAAPDRREANDSGCRAS